MLNVLVCHGFMNYSENAIGETNHRVYLFPFFFSLFNAAVTNKYGLYGFRTDVVDSGILVLYSRVHFNNIPRLTATATAYKELKLSEGPRNYCPCRFASA